MRLSPNTANPNALVYVDPSGTQLAPYIYVSSYDGRGYQAADLAVYPTPNSSNMTDVYRSSGAPSFIAMKPKSCQIISPGADGLYGSGGYFSVTAPNHGLSSKADYDNITNFHGSLLSE